MSKHTPGPWGYLFFTTGADEKNRTDCFITQRSMKTDNDVDLIATVYKISDARLISTAPEMYECLKAFMYAVDTTRDLSRLLDDAYVKADAILKRIEGEEEAE